MNVETGATTMNSTPLVIPNTSTTTQSGSVNVYGPNGYAVIRVYDEAGNVIETREQAGDFKEW
jgi:hypothetical protein